MSLLRNQSIFQEPNTYKSTFLLVHDDSFGRDVSEEEFTKIIKEDGYTYSITILSKNQDGNVNVALVSYITAKFPIDTEYIHNEMPGLHHLDVIRYYEILPCDWNEVTRMGKKINLTVKAMTQIIGEYRKAKGYSNNQLPVKLAHESLELISADIHKDEENFEDELADIFIYAHGIAALRRLDVEEIIQKKIEKDRGRTDQV